MQYEGVLRKMQTEIGSPIQYYMVFENDFLNVNQVLDKTLEINFIKSQCLNCGQDRAIYRQGFCKSCFFDIPSAGDWIMRPELSTAHLDKEDRDLEYEKKYSYSRISFISPIQVISKSALPESLKCPPVGSTKAPMKRLK